MIWCMDRKTEIKLIKLGHRLSTLETETEANMALLQINIEKSKSENNEAISNNNAAIERLRTDIVKQFANASSEKMQRAIWIILGIGSVTAVSQIVVGVIFKIFPSLG